MSRTIALRVDPEIGFDAENLQNYLVKNGFLDARQNNGWQLLKRSIDARGRQVKVQLSVALNDAEIPAERLNQPKYQQVKNQAEVHIIGAGPAGMFAALKLIELCIKPVLLERVQKDPQLPIPTTTFCNECRTSAQGVRALRGGIR